MRKAGLAEAASGISVSARYARSPHHRVVRVALLQEIARNYIAHRQTKGIANGTINRELSLLGRAFNLARLSTPPRVVAVPYNPMLEERNVRKGFFEDEKYRALFAELPDYLQPLLAFAYFTGCRRAKFWRCNGARLISKGELRDWTPAPPRTTRLGFLPTDA